MIKSDLVKALGKNNRIMLSQTEIAEVLGIGKNAVKDLMIGTACFADGRTKRYFVGDIADRIMERTRK